MKSRINHRLTIVGKYQKQVHKTFLFHTPNYESRLNQKFSHYIYSSHNNLIYNQSYNSRNQIHSYEIYNVDDVVCIFRINKALNCLD